MEIIKALLNVLGKLISPKNPEKPSDPVEKVNVVTNNGRVTRVKDVSLIKEFEGLKLKAYQDVVGVWTIGYGHTHTAKPGMVITAGEAERLLRVDLDWVEAAINKNVTVKLTQNQYDALASFIYNVGATNFRRSTLLDKLNDGDYAGASAEFRKWNKAGGKVVRGLTRRRKAEEAWFNGRTGA